MSDVSTPRSEYVNREQAWKLVSDAVSGEEKVKEGKELYLPRPNPLDLSVEATKRYEQYLARAVYYNAVGRTASSLVGMAYHKWPDVVLPPGLEYLLEDADGSGVGLINQSQETVNRVLEKGRAGLLADYPSTEGSTSKADQEAGGIRATIQLYDALSIINWRTVKRGAQNVLGLCVLRECVEVWDEFELTEVTQYRVLRLGAIDGDMAAEYYIQDIWQKDTNGTWVITETRVPTDGTGKKWDLIPFTFIGSKNNDSTPDSIPLYDLATLNLAHYRNSADYEESVFFVGQAQVWVIGADAQWMEEQQKAGIYFGSRAVGAAPQGGDVKLLQASPNTLSGEALKGKEEQMAALGARLVMNGEVAKTATQSNSDETSSHSVLSLVCDNVSDAYRKALAWCGMFMRETGEVDFSINTEFTGLHFDAQQVAQALALVQAGKMPEADLWTYLRTIGLIDPTKSDDDIRGEVEASDAGLGLGENVISTP